MLTLCLSATAPAWHRDLLVRLGFVRAQAFRAHRHLPASEREEAVADVTADVTAGLARLSSRRATHAGLVRPLTEYAIRRRAAGRRVGTPTNRRDVLSPVPRRSCRVQSLEAGRGEGGLSWRDVLPDSRRADPAEIASARIDLAAWLDGLPERLRLVAECLISNIKNHLHLYSLPERLRLVAECLAAGERPGELAARLGISPGRLSQLRAELRERWAEFCSEPAAAAE